MEVMLMKALVVMVACMVMSAPHAEAVSCGTVVTKMLPCLGYLQKGGSPNSLCCTGVKSVNAGAKTIADRQATCACLKSASATYSSRINPANGESLPGKCGVTIPYKISPTTDCTKVT